MELRLILKWRIMRKLDNLIYYWCHPSIAWLIENHKVINKLKCPNTTTNFLDNTKCQLYLGKKRALHTSRLTEVALFE